MIVNLKNKNKMFSWVTSMYIILLLVWMFNYNNRYKIILGTTIYVTIQLFVYINIMCLYNSHNVEYTSIVYFRYAHYIIISVFFITLLLLILNYAVQHYILNNAVMYISLLYQVVVCRYILIPLKDFIEYKHKMYHISLTLNNSPQRYGAITHGHNPTYHPFSVTL